MKNAMKKLLSLMLVAVLLVSAVPFKASAAAGDTVDFVLIPEFDDNTVWQKGENYIRVTLDGNGHMSQEDYNALYSAVISKGITGWQINYTGSIKDVDLSGYKGNNILPVFGSESGSSSSGSDESVSNESVTLWVDFASVIGTPAEWIEGVAGNYIRVYLTENGTMRSEDFTRLKSFVEAKGIEKWDLVYTGSIKDFDLRDRAGTTIRPAAFVATEPTETQPTPTEPTPTEPEKPVDNSVLYIGNGDNYITLTLDMNYEGSTDRYVKAVDPNTKMGVIMQAIKENNMIPTRKNYTFAGWYWDDDFDYPVKDNDYLTDSTHTSLRIYARWTRNSSAPNTFLKIYLNGKTSSPAKIVKISDYGDADGTIDIFEAKRVAGNYYSSTGYDGLFTDTTWNGGAYENSTQANSVAVSSTSDTFVYIMLWGAKTVSSSSSSSSTADSTNPKTGDSIYMVATVMGLSAAALAAVYYVSKKRAF